MLDLVSMTEKQLDELRADLERDLNTEAQNRRGDIERRYYDLVYTQLEAVEIELLWRRAKH